MTCTSQQVKFMLFKDAVKAIKDVPGSTAFVCHFMAKGGVVHASACTLKTGKNKVWVEVSEFEAEKHPIEINQRKVGNKKQVKTLFGERFFAVVDNEIEDINEMFLIGLGLPLSKDNMEGLAQAYMKSKFYYEYEKPSIKGFRKGFRK